LGRVRGHFDQSIKTIEKGKKGLAFACRKQLNHVTLIWHGSPDLKGFTFKI